MRNGCFRILFFIPYRYNRPKKIQIKNIIVRFVIEKKPNLTFL